MREHLYQGKDTDSGKWVQGDLVTNGIDYDAAIRINDKTSSEYGQIVKVDPDTVSEYTGLTDKNGTKIFEGHIVMAKVGCRTFMGIVKYDEKCAMYIVEAFGRKKYKTDYTDKFCFSCEYITEVIGNKWVNPELLQEA